MLSRPPVLLQLEELSLLIAGVAVYTHLHGSWWLFGVLFLAPDLFMLGYLLNVRLGTALYNLGHVVFVPLGFVAAGYGTGRMTMVDVGIIWFCHIAFDRMLGYGLKYPTRFKDTHLQHIS